MKKYDEIKAYVILPDGSQILLDRYKKINSYRYFVILGVVFAVLIVFFVALSHGYAVETETGKPGTDILLEARDISPVDIPINIRKSSLLIIADGITIDMYIENGRFEVETTGNISESAKKFFNYLKQYIRENYIIIPKEVKSE